MVRHLPVLPSNDETEAQRPVWQRVLIGTGFVITIWLPLSLLPVPSFLGVIGRLLTFATAAFFAGVLAGRFIGSRPLETGLSGLIAVLVFWSFAMAKLALPLWPVGLATFAVLVTVVVLFSSLGAKLGQMSRAKG